LAVVGQMAASLAHEIGTPLNAISGHLEFLTANKSNDSDSRRRIRIIRQQLDFIVGTVRRLVYWTHNREIVFEPVDLEKLVREVLWLVKPTLEEHSITAKLTISHRMPPLEANREALQQVFLNLINNSIEAMDGGGQISIAMKLDDQSGSAEVLFQDTGVGISPQDAQHLFEPMWTTKASGGGFGLAIAQETIAAHGGEIEVLPDQVVGAGFRLRLPLTQAKAFEEELISHVA
jgi:signal transduction histidine kinase